MHIKVQKEIQFLLFINSTLFTTAAVIFGILVGY